MMRDFNIKNVTIFNGIDENYISEFLSACETIVLPKGEYLFHQNEIGDSMFIVATGIIQLIINNKEIGKRESGSLIGELCVFGQNKRSASVLALNDCTLIEIKGEDFRTRIFSKELDALLICFNISKKLSSYLIETDSRLFL